MKKHIPPTFMRALTSDRSCGIVRATGFDVTRGTARAQAVSFPLGEKLVDLHLKSTLVWKANRLLLEALHLFLSPDLLFSCLSKERFAYWHIPASWIFFCFLHSKFFVQKAKKCDDYSFCSKIWAEFWAVKTLSNCKISFPQAFYVMGDKGVGKQIYCLFFLKAFLLILDTGNRTFAADAIGFLPSILFFGVINKIGYPFLNLLLLCTFKGHVIA